MAIQSTYYSATSSVSSNPAGTCLFSGAQTAGKYEHHLHRRILLHGGCADERDGRRRQRLHADPLDAATQERPAATGTRGSISVSGIKAAAAGTNAVSVVMSGTCGYAFLSIAAVEEPASAGIRDAKLNFQEFSGQFPNVTLTGTVLGDVVCAFAQCEPDDADYVQVGAIGANSATQLELFYPNNSTELIFLAQDGSSPGGTISVTATGTMPNIFTAVAVALIPAGPAGIPVPYWAPYPVGGANLRW